MLQRLNCWKELGPLGVYGNRRSVQKTHISRPVVVELYVTIRAACFPSGPNVVGNLETADRSSGICEAERKRGRSTGLAQSYGDVASSDDDNPYGLGAPFWQYWYPI